MGWGESVDDCFFPLLQEAVRVCWVKLVRSFTPACVAPGFVAAVFARRQGRLPLEWRRGGEPWLAAMLQPLVEDAGAGVVVGAALADAVDGCGGEVRNGEGWWVGSGCEWSSLCFFCFCRCSGSGRRGW